MWSAPVVSVLYFFFFFGRAGALLVSLLASPWVLDLVLVSLSNDMGVVVLAVLLLVFELFGALEVLVVLLFGSKDNQLLVGLVSVLDVELVSQLAYR